MLGHETAGGSIVFILWKLACQPAIQVIKIVSHLSLIIDDMVRTGLERNFCCMGDLSDDDIQKIEFLDAVVKEGRVYP
jgi:hypothetical protein